MSSTTGKKGIKKAPAGKAAGATKSKVDIIFDSPSLSSVQKLISANVEPEAEVEIQLVL